MTTRRVTARASDRTVFFGMGQDSAGEVGGNLLAKRRPADAGGLACDRYLTVEEP